MSWTISRPAAVLALVLVCACAERMLDFAECGNGEAEPGEACYGERRLEIPVDDIIPHALRVDDFDGDGDGDVMVLGISDAGAVTARLHAGDGNGAFAPPIDPGIWGCSAHAVPGRLDDDLSADLLVDDCDSSMLIFLGSDSGQYGEAIRVDVGVATLTSSLVDVDGDGVADLIALGTAADGSNDLVVRRGDGTGAFAPASVTSATASGLDPSGFGVGRFDEDDLPDVVLVDGIDPGGLAWMRDIGEGVLAAPALLPSLPLGPTIVRDFDGDGTLDVVVADGETLRFFEGDGSDGFVDTGTVTPLDLPIVVGVVDDVDNDEHLDLAFASMETPLIAVLLADRSGGFASAAVVDVGAGSDQIALRDLDDDGAADLVAANFAARRIAIVFAEP